MLSSLREYWDLWSKWVRLLCGFGLGALWGNFGMSFPYDFLILQGEVCSV